MEYFDTIVVGAGLSGISAGYRLQTELPTKTYIILEGRESIGGTWDLFRYPGIRSDSDMYTLGYSFAPWLGNKTLADGSSILNYIRKTAQDYNIMKNIRLGTKVLKMSWDSSASLWTISCNQIRNDGNSTSNISYLYSCRFIFLCTGYYSYEEGYTPSFPGQNDFLGQIIHPQKWPEDLDYSNKKVVVIGSGATAVTLVPAMAGKTAHITMLQRSPTYVLPLPNEDILSIITNMFVPSAFAHKLNRYRNIFLMNFTYYFCKTFPSFSKFVIMKVAKQFLNSKQKVSNNDKTSNNSDNTSTSNGNVCDVDVHFNPSYHPWDQRLCIVPDGDLFHALNSGRASIRTATIETFTERGIRIRNKFASDDGKSMVDVKGDGRDGGGIEDLEADIIITATGLNICLAGGIQCEVDGEIVKSLNDKFLYKGVMLSGIPNLVMAVGYTNQSFTLKVDLIGTYVCRILSYMEKHGYRKCTPRYGHREGESFDDKGEDVIELSSSYIRRTINQWPRAGKHAPWKMSQSYWRDMISFFYSSLNDGVLMYE